MRDVVVVTGGTGGVGADLARRLVRDGYCVSFTYRGDAAGAEQLLAELRATDPECTAHRLDVTDPAAVAGYGSFLAERYQVVYGLVNSAGISNNSDPVVDLPVAAWDAIIAVNLTGTFLLCRSVVPLIMAGGRGRVVNISSIFGRHTPAQRAAYGASKHGVIGLTEALAKELGPLGITANAVCPGGIRSPMQERMWEVTAARRGLTLEQFGASRLAQIPLGRVCEPSDVSAAVMFLLGEGGGFITGASLDVTGGAI